MSHPAIDRAVVTYAKFVIRWRWLVLLTVLVGTAAAVMGAKNLVFVTDYKYFFGPDNPQLKEYLHVEETYTKSDNIVFVLIPDEGDAFQDKVLNAARMLTEQSWQLPYSVRVDSITNFQHTWSYEDDLIVEDLLSKEGEITDQARTRVREVSMNEPLLVNRLIAADGGATGVNVTFQMPEGGSPELEIADAARLLADEVREAFPGIYIGVTGEVMISTSFNESAERDIQQLTPLMLLAIIIAIAFFMRSLWATITIMLVAIFSTMTAMGISGWLGINISAVSATAPTIILTIAIADGVHILVTLAYEMRAGKNKYEALVESLRLNWQPVFLTTLTTVIGFLSLNASEVPPFNDLGNKTAIGVAMAWLYSISLLPAIVAIVPYRVSQGPQNPRISGARFAEWLIKRRNAVFYAAIGTLIVCASFIPRIELNDLFVQYFDETVQFRRDTDLMTERLTGIYIVHFSVGAGSEQGISDPQYLEKLQRFSDWLRAQPEVSHVLTLNDILKRLNKNLHSDDPDYFRLPDDRELAAQYLLLYEMSLPYGLDLNNQIDVGKSATKVTATVLGVSAEDLRQLKFRAEDWLAGNTPEAMHAKGAGSALMFSFISLRNIESMASGTVIAFFLISLVIAIALRSVRLGIISLIPNIAPALMAFGLWGLIVQDVGFSVATVTAASLGIIVDATVHFLSKYLRARREQGASTEDAVRYALRTVGGALWITFAILAAGFAVFALSSFKINADFGLLVAITIVAALVADFLLLPTILMRADARKQPLGSS
ncbi:MAG: MMPL family transporter [Pseudomonadota bacterium]